MSHDSPTKTPFFLFFVIFHFEKKVNLLSLEGIVSLNTQTRMLTHMLTIVILARFQLQIVLKIDFNVLIKSFTFRF